MKKSRPFALLPGAYPSALLWGAKSHRRKCKKKKICEHEKNEWRNGGKGHGEDKQEEKLSSDLKV